MHIETERQRTKDKHTVPAHGHLAKTQFETVGQLAQK